MWWYECRNERYSSLLNLLSRWIFYCMLIFVYNHLRMKLCLTNISIRVKLFRLVQTWKGILHQCWIVIVLPLIYVYLSEVYVCISCVFCLLLFIAIIFVYCLVLRGISVQSTTVAAAAETARTVSIAAFPLDKSAEQESWEADGGQHTRSPRTNVIFSFIHKDSCVIGEYDNYLWV